MMKFFNPAFLGVMLATSSAFASSESLTFTPDIKYTVDLHQKFGAFPTSVDKVLGHATLTTLVGNGQLFTVNALDQMQRIYISQNSNSNDGRLLILGKTGMKVSGPVRYGEIYYTAGAFIVHFQTKDSGDLALFFKGFKQDRVQEIKIEISKSLKGEMASAGKAYPWPQLLLNAANAEEVVPSGSLCSNSFQKTPESPMDTSALQKIWNCTKGFGGGVWGATGGAVVNLSKMAFTATLNPEEAFNRAADEFGKIKNLLADLENSFGTLKTEFQALPPDVRIKIECEVISSIGTTGLIAFFTAGSGSPLLFRTIAQSLAKASNHIPKNTATYSKVFVMAARMDDKANSAQASVNTLKKLSIAEKVGQAELKLLEHGKEINVAAPLAAQWGVAEFLSDAKLMAGLKKLDPELFRQIQAQAKNLQKLQYAKVFQEITREALTAAKKEVLLTPTQLAALIAYVSASSCTLKSAVVSTGSPDKKASVDNKGVR